VTTQPSGPASTNRAGRKQAQAHALRSLQHQAAAQGAHRLAIQAKAQAIASQSDDLRRQVQQHLDKQKHARTTAQLVSLIITRYPDCPRFASLMVDRLMAGDEALAEALQEGLR
jgi:hypothetical protein